MVLNAFSGTFTTGSLSGQTYYFNGAFGFGEAGNSFAGQKLDLPFNTYYLPFVYEFGQYIGWDANWQEPGVLGSLNYFIDPEDAEGTTGGYWLNRSDGYLALRFQIEGNTHFGWIRLDVTEPGGANTIVVKDFAYELIPWQGINAGAINGGSTTGIEEIEIPGLRLYSFASQVHFGHSNSEALDLEILDLNGQLLHSGHYPAGDHQIVVQQHGILLVRLTDRTKGILSRRLYLSN